MQLKGWIVEPLYGWSQILSGPRCRLSYSQLRPHHQLQPRCREWWNQFLGTMVQITARFILIQEGHISQKVTFNRWKSVLQEWTSCWSTWWNSCWQSCFCRIPNPFDQIKIRKFVSSTNWTIFDTIWTCCFVVSRWNHDETPISPHLWNGRHCWNQW